MAGQIIPSNPAQQAQQAAMYRQMAAIPADVRAFIGDQYGQTQISVLPLPYWSTVRFQSTQTGSTTKVFTIDTSDRKAFAYAIGQDRAIGGFPTAAGVAQLCDTNLLKANETRDNSDVWIWGLAASITPDSEPALARRVWRDTAVQISLNGTQSIPLGTFEMFPSAGGLFGQGTTYLKSPATNVSGPTSAEAGAGAQMGFVTNGNPMAGNFFRLPQPFKWAAVGSAGSDSSLIITCTPNRLIQETAIARAAVAPISMTTSVGTAPYTPPAADGDPGTYVDVRWHLVCVAVAKRSANV